MLRSKSRSGFVDSGHQPKPKRHSYSSVLPRSFSGSKLCRGDALISQVNTDALISRDHRNNFSSRFFKSSRIQEQIMGDLEEDLKRTKEILDVTLAQRDEAVAEANSVHAAEIRALQESLEVRDKDLNFLRSQLENAKQFQLELAERQAALDKLNQELSQVKANEARTMSSWSESNQRIKELEAQIEQAKLSESNMLESIVSQTKLLEQTKMELEESKLEVASLKEQLGKLQASSPKRLDPVPVKERGSEEAKPELQEGASSDAKQMLDEMSLLKNELKLATEAEEKSRKAMDDLALALKEVATEASQAKEKLALAEAEVGQLKEDTEKLKEMVRTSEDKYKKLLDEARRETDLYKNTGERLRLEAEESLLAWNGKEMGFVSCIKRAEEERDLVKHENVRLAENLKAAEIATRTAKEESYKLRDILKQAINEANVAKEAASIARTENSDLKDVLAEKDEALLFLTRENERIRISEVAALENIKELKRLLSVAKTEDKEQVDVFNSPDSSVCGGEEFTDAKEPKKGFSFDLNELKIFNKPEPEEVDADEEDPEKAEALKGSIFDTTVSPKSEPQTPKPAAHHRRDSSIFTDAASYTPSSEDCENASSGHGEDADEKTTIKKRYLFRRLGDLIVRKSFHKREPSITE